MISILEVVSGIMSPVGAPVQQTSTNNNSNIKNKEQTSTNNNSNIKNKEQTLQKKIFSKDINNNAFENRMKDTTIRNSLTNKPTKTPNVFRYTV